MIRMQGVGVSRGVAAGKLKWLREAAAALRAAGSPQEEQARFVQAQMQAEKELTDLAAKAEGTAREILSTHALLLQDEDLSDSVRQGIQDGMSAETALQHAGNELVQALAGMEDAYLRERAADVRDVVQRLIRCLGGNEEQCLSGNAPCILAAAELSPSQTAQLDRKMVLGILLKGGSPVSHTAILARTMGIPAICGLGAALDAAQDGDQVCMDGETGCAALAPDDEELQSIQRKREAQQARRNAAERVRGLPDVTRTGRGLRILCSVSALEDLTAARESDAWGIGLLRSEFLCLAAGTLPDEESQYRAYRTAVEAVPGKRVVIRTLDIGADKQIGGLSVPREENPALGLRGIRLGLSQPEVLRVQLRALLRASAHGCLAVLLPMIASLWEVRACREMLAAAMEELSAEGAAFRRDIELGVMIETPAAVLIAPQLAQEVDYFSIGTNDLTQYLLACDRQSGELARFCDPKHPAVWAALRQTADAAHRAGIPVCVCGELAADESLLSEWLAVGVEEITVPPREVLPLRAALRGL